MPLATDLGQFDAFLQFSTTNKNNPNSTGGGGESAWEFGTIPVGPFSLEGGSSTVGSSSEPETTGGGGGEAGRNGINGRNVHQNDGQNEGGSSSHEGESDGNEEEEERDERREEDEEGGGRGREENDGEKRWPPTMIKEEEEEEEIEVFCGGKESANAKCHILILQQHAAAPHPPPQFSPSPPLRSGTDSLSSPRSYSPASQKLALAIYNGRRGLFLGRLIWRGIYSSHIHSQPNN
jgi:hypothetical protein